MLYISTGVHSDPDLTRRRAGRLRHDGRRPPQLLVHLPSMLCPVPDRDGEHRRMRSLLEVSYRVWVGGRTRSSDASLWVDGVGHDDTERWRQRDLRAR